MKNKILSIAVILLLTCLANAAAISTTTTIPCSDTDGVNYAVKGTAVSSVGSQWSDACGNSYGGGTVVNCSGIYCTVSDHACYNFTGSTRTYDGVYYKYEPCPNGCLDGACSTLASNLQVNTNPTNASLYVDSTYKGLTPITVTSLTTGLHNVQITKTGYLTYNTNTTINTGTTKNLTITLTPITTTSTSTTSTTSTTICDTYCKQLAYLAGGCFSWACDDQNMSARIFVGSGGTLCGPGTPNCCCQTTYLTTLSEKPANPSVAFAGSLVSDTIFDTLFRLPAGEVVSIRENNCSGTVKCSCSITERGSCACNFTAPLAAGLYKYVGCSHLGATPTEYLLVNPTTTTTLPTTTSTTRTTTSSTTSSTRTTTTSTTTITIPGRVCSSANEGSQISITCPSGTINSIIRADYIDTASSIGCPNGGVSDACWQYCDAANSCIGQQTCSFLVSNDNCGNDPCYATPKKLILAATCQTTPTTLPRPTTTTLTPTTSTLGSGSCKPINIDCRYDNEAACSGHPPCTWFSEAGFCQINNEHDHFPICLMNGGNDAGTCNNRAFCVNWNGNDCWNCQWDITEERCNDGATCQTPTGPAGGFFNIVGLSENGVMVITGFAVLIVIVIAYSLREE